jgi:glycosyltransferase involved in cell wall biosynthesis
MRIVLTVTTDLNFDQRMMRICSSLHEAGFSILLVGRERSNSKPILTKPYKQKRLPCWFQKGKLFYAEYNIRLFLYLLFAKMDVICAIDLDTILPCLFVSQIRSKKRVYDAHELFCEMDEIVSRPTIYKAWKMIEAFAVPKFKQGYTIGECYANEFKKMYNVNYGIVRNATKLEPLAKGEKKSDYILYQGAVNEGRCFEQLIPAMQHVNAQLIICGEGNFFEQAQALVKQYKLDDKVTFKGYVEPTELKEYTKRASIGITLFSNQGKSNYYSMANRFFDYMHFCVPQICMAYPEYENVNSKYEIANLVHEVSASAISNALNDLLTNEIKYQQLKLNCLQAREEYCWQKQEEVLKQVYQNL